MKMTTLYSLPTCPQCRMVHAALDKNQIRYTECQDVDTMRTKDIWHVPVLEVEGRMLQGKELLNWIAGVK